MKNRITIIILCLLLLFPLNASAFAVSNNILNEVISIPLGNNQDEIGVQNLPGGSTLGPDSFAVLDDGTILILDSTNKKILKYTDRRIASVYDLSFTNEPKDIVVTSKGKIYILDISPGTIYSLSDDGNIEKRVELPDYFPVHRVLKLGLSVSDEVTVRLFTDEEFLLSDLAQGIVEGHKGYECLNSNNRINVEKINEQAFEVKGLSSIINIVGNGMAREVTVEGIDPSYNAYIYNIDLNPNSSKVQGERYLSKFDKTGKLVGRIHLQSDKIFSPTRDIYITPLGKAYWMVVTDRHTKIFEITFNDIEPLIEFPLNKTISNFQILSSTPYSRVQLMSRADNQINYSWVYNTANGTNPPDYVTKPDWLLSISYGTMVTGIPYCWGGFDSTYTSSASAYWTNFGNAMSQGKYAGNVYLSGIYKFGTAGLDCSGFVSAVAGFSSHHSTYEIYDDDSYEIENLIDRLSMDIFIDRPEHVLFYFGDLTGYGIATKESCTAGADKVKDYSRTWTWLSDRGYELRRLEGL